jgi:hypothetical protein
MSSGHTADPCFAKCTLIFKANDILCTFQTSWTKDGLWSCEFHIRAMSLNNGHLSLAYRLSLQMLSVLTIDDANVRDFQSEAEEQLTFTIKNPLGTMAMKEGPEVVPATKLQELMREIRDPSRAG